MKILKQAMQGALRDVSLNWSLPPELKVTVLPEKFPAIFSGDKLVMYAVIKGAAVSVNIFGTLEVIDVKNPLS